MSSPDFAGDYGDSGVLSELKITLRALAWPVVLGAVIGFGLAISLLIVPDSSTHQPREKTSQPQVRPQETSL